MRVLVLCHGSVNRSPFVAGLIRKERPNWHVRVAGLHTRFGRPATPKAKRAAAALGFSLEEHRSEPVSGTMIDWADVVLYMDGGNKKRLQGLVDQATMESKCRLLASYGSLRRVPDPNYTSDPEELRRMFSVAELCTMKFLEAHPA